MADLLDWINGLAIREQSFPVHGRTNTLAIGLADVPIKHNSEPIYKEDFDNSTELVEIYHKRNLLSCECPLYNFWELHGDVAASGDDPRTVLVF